MERTRRGLLAAGATAGLVSLSGCLDALDSGNGIGGSDGGDLSGQARSLLRDATGEGYAETHPFSETYRTVLTWLHARAYLDGNVEKDAYVEDPGAGMALYDGSCYRYRLRFVTRS